MFKKSFLVNPILYIIESTKSMFINPLFRLGYEVYLTSGKYAYLTSLFIRLSTSYFTSQLIDLLAYELPSLLKQKKIITTYDSNKSSLVSRGNKLVYVLHFYLAVTTKSLFFFFLLNKGSSTKFKSKNDLVSIEDLFYNSNWGEREVSEMSGIFFSNKGDCRNLLTPYGDFFFPLNKYFPSMGLFEFIYSILMDIIYKDVNSHSI